MTGVVILGGGWAGMLAARAFAESAGRVVLVESSTYPDAPVPRLGMPQGHHNHVLVAGGAEALDSLLPGAVDELLAAGARRIDLPGDALVLGADGWFLRHRTGAELIVCSRWLLDHIVRRRVLKDHGTAITVFEGCRALGLRGDRERVTGVEVRAGAAPPTVLDAELVLDATGRRSRSADWLARIARVEVPEETLDTGLAYATRFYQAPEGGGERVPAVLIHPAADPRGATLFPIEGGRWIVTLTGTREARPPADPAGFERCAAGLRSPVIAELTSRAVPLGAVRPYRDTANRRRHFESAALPAGFLALGDALVALNPVYSHGMAVAALQARWLRETLAAKGPGGVASTELQAGVAAVAEECWRMATRADGRFTAAPHEPASHGPVPPESGFAYEMRAKLAYRKLGSRILVSDFFRRQMLIPTAAIPPADLVRELSSGPARPLGTDEAVGQYPGLAGLRAGPR